MTMLSPLDLKQINPDDFEIRTPDDEIRVDELCSRLLLAVRNKLLEEGTFDPVKAGTLCQGADYFLREFVIAECNDNLFRFPAERIRQFAGHWYIVRNIEPNIGELTAVLSGVSACYHVLAEVGLVDPELVESVGLLCADLTYYQKRIEDFWTIEGDGFLRWRSVCPLPERRT